MEWPSWCWVLFFHTYFTSICFSYYSCYRYLFSYFVCHFHSSPFTLSNLAGTVHKHYDTLSNKTLLKAEWVCTNQGWLHTLYIQESNKLEFQLCARYQWWHTFSYFMSKNQSSSWESNRHQLLKNTPPLLCSQKHYGHHPWHHKSRFFQIFILHKYVQKWKREERARNRSNLMDCWTIQKTSL